MAPVNEELSQVQSALDKVENSLVQNRVYGAQGLLRNTSTITRISGGRYFIEIPSGSMVKTRNLFFFCFVLFVFIKLHG